MEPNECRAFTEIGKQWEMRFGRELKSLIWDMLGVKVPLHIQVKKVKGGNWIYQPGAQGEVKTGDENLGVNSI